MYQRPLSRWVCVGIFFILISSQYFHDCCILLDESQSTNWNASTAIRMQVECYLMVSLASDIVSVCVCVCVSVYV